MTHTTKLLAVMLGMTLCADALAWGQTGHRITGEIAQQHLSASAQSAVSALLPDEDLAEASTYADEMRSDPAEFWQKTAGPYHYVTIPKGKVYADVGAPEQGDAISALEGFRSTVLSKDASLEDKQIALRFIVHIIGDLHQPLHAGDGTDKGGNDVKLKFFWEDSNLHRVWDSGMIDRQQLSYTEWTKRLDRKISDEDVKAWSVTDPNVWVAESSLIRDTIYPQESDLSWNYQYVQLPVAEERLQMAGIRLAAYLNQLFAK